MRRDGRRRLLRTALVLVLVAVAAAGRAAGANPQADAGQDPAGFWLGPWHGFITPVTFGVSRSSPEAGAARRPVLAEVPNSAP